MIVKYWTSQEGRDRLEKYREQFGLELEFDQMLTRDNYYFCFGCYEYEKSWRSFERAHIIPAMLNGSNDPSNFVMLCKECHHKNPNTPHDEVYFKWLDKVEFCTARDHRRLLKAFRDFKVNPQTISKIYLEKGEDYFIDMAWKAAEECGLHGGSLNYSSFAGALSVRIRQWEKADKPKTNQPIGEQLELF
jgi:hypothetical protein